VNMQFDQAGEIIVPVTWYFAAPGAKQLPAQHPFGSQHTWALGRLPTLGLGERWDSLTPYYNGAQPFYAPGSGSFCGPLDWFENGCPSDAPPINYSDAGVPVCCPQPPCQPWAQTGSHPIGLAVAGGPTGWTVDASQVGSVVWLDSTATNVLQAIELDSTLCFNQLPTELGFTDYLGNIADLNCIAYVGDATGGVGTWTLPSTYTGPYVGMVVTLTMPT